VPRELAHLVGIVSNKRAHAELDGVCDVLVPLDGMRMNAALGCNTQPLDELHFAGRGEIEETAFCNDRIHDGGVRHGLQSIMKIDPRQRLAQFPVLHAYPLAVEDNQRRAELLHQAPDLRRLEGINESCLAQLRTPKKAAGQARAGA
jgi:hypothetical protein